MAWSTEKPDIFHRVIVASYFYLALIGGKTLLLLDSHLLLCHYCLSEEALWLFQFISPSVCTGITIGVTDYSKAWPGDNLAKPLFIILSRTCWAISSCKLRSFIYLFFPIQTLFLISFCWWHLFQLFSIFLWFMWFFMLDLCLLSSVTVLLPLCKAMFLTYASACRKG